MTSRTRTAKPGHSTSTQWRPECYDDTSCPDMKNGPPDQDAKSHDCTALPPASLTRRTSETTPTHPVGATNHGSDGKQKNEQGPSLSFTSPTQPVEKLLNLQQGGTGTASEFRDGLLTHLLLTGDLNLGHPHEKSSHNAALTGLKAEYRLVAQNEDGVDDPLTLTPPPSDPPTASGWMRSQVRMKDLPCILEMMSPSRWPRVRPTTPSRPESDVLAHRPHRFPPRPPPRRSLRRRYRSASPTHQAEEGVYAW